MLATTAKVAARFGRNRMANLKSVLAGRPLVLPSLGSTTLDRDDVDLAWRWLEQPERWFERDPVEEFERSFARWNGSEHAYAFIGGRVALSACIEALELEAGDQVIVPGYTCVVVPNAFDYAGIEVVYCDIELETFGPDIESVETRLTSRTRAIVIQHLYGLVCRHYEALLELARRRGLKVIEDCAHCTGAEFKGRKIGSFSDLAFYSCEQSKLFTTIQGGLAVTNDPALAVGLERYRDRAPYPQRDWIRSLLHNIPLNYYQCKHSQRWWIGEIAEHRYGRFRLISTTAEEERGRRPAHYGCRMPAPVAAIGLNQLRKLDGYNRARRSGAQRWRAWCAAQGYAAPLELPESEPVYLRFPVLVEAARKTDTSWAVEQLKVAPGVWFMTHLHPAQREVRGCPRADRAVRECINFPCLP